MNSTGQSNAKAEKMQEENSSYADCKDPDQYLSDHDLNFSSVFGFL